MKKYIIGLLILAFTVTTFAQKEKIDPKKKAADLAKAAFEAHGGEKLKEMKTLSVLGSVDVTVSSFNQAFPATFATIYSGDKYLLEINSQFARFKQTFDGEKTVTSPNEGFSLPPMNRIGPLLLKNFGDEGFIVSEIADKKKDGFRITSPEGYFSDFYFDSKKNKIKGYSSSYLFNGREVTTTVEIDNFIETEGVLIPSKYAQRFELGQMTVYAEFKAKEIKINKEVADTIFGG